MIDDRKKCPTSELDYKASRNYITLTNNYIVYAGDTINGIPNGEGIKYASV